MPGAQAYLDMVNAAGGVHGRKVILESLDDALDAKRTVENTRVLGPGQEGVLPVPVPRHPAGGGRDSPAERAEGAVDRTFDRRAVDAFPLPKRYLFPVRASYGSEVEEAVNHLTTTGVTKIALIRDDSSSARTASSAFEAAMKKRGIAPHGVAVFPRGSTQVDEAVKKLAAAQPQAVLIVASPNSAAAIVKRMRGPSARTCCCSPCRT